MNQERFLRSAALSIDGCHKYLDTLVGCGTYYGQIVRVVDWQIVPAEAYSYKVVVRVEVSLNDDAGCQCPQCRATHPEEDREINFAEAAQEATYVDPDSFIQGPCQDDPENYDSSQPPDEIDTAITDEDFPFTFFASDRQTAKEHAKHPVTSEYIERLERIARAADAVYSEIVAVQNPSPNMEELWAALDRVDVLNEQ